MYPPVYPFSLYPLSLPSVLPGTKIAHKMDMKIKTEIET